MRSRAENELRERFGVVRGAVRAATGLLLADRLDRVATRQRHGPCANRRSFCGWPTMTPQPSLAQMERWTCTRLAGGPTPPAAPGAGAHKSGTLAGQDSSHLRLPRLLEGVVVLRPDLSAYTATVVLSGRRCRRAVRGAFGPPSGSSSWRTAVSSASPVTSRSAVGPGQPARTSPMSRS